MVVPAARYVAVACAALLAVSEALSDLAVNAFHEATLVEDAAEPHSYRVWLTQAAPDVKVVLLPLSGDADVLVSFDANANSTTSGSASWSMAGSGIEELLLRRDVFCRTSSSVSSSSGSSSSKSSCYLYLQDIEQVGGRQVMSV